MGNTTSTASAISSIVNKTVENVLLENVASCNQTNTTIQEIDISNVKGLYGCKVNVSGISQVQYSKPDFSCFNSQKANASLVTALNTALSQAAYSSANGGLGNTSSDSNTISNITNEITKNINMSNVSNCSQNAFANQKNIIKNISGSCPSLCHVNLKDPKIIMNLPESKLKTISEFQSSNACTIDVGNIKQNLTASVIGTCVNNNVNLADTISTIANNVNQTSTSISTGADLLGSLASAGSWWILIIICIIIILIASSVSMYQNKK
jgi:hypothetical protein